MRFLILQHPKEARAPLGSARLLSLATPSTVHKVGLSWRSLRHALGTQADPKEWGVLFLGTQKGSKKPTPPRQLKGVVLLDGNWKQSKTLWWRNPWLLKLHRVILSPQEGSHYGTLRRQPRAGCLSTLEAGAATLAEMGETEASEKLIAYFDAFLEKAQATPSLGHTPGSPSEPLLPATH